MSSDLCRQVTLGAVHQDQAFGKSEVFADFLGFLSGVEIACMILFLQLLHKETQNVHSAALQSNFPEKD